MAPSPSLSSTWTQFHPQAPDFTEKDLPSLEHKVYVVTGSNSGVGKEVARMLYTKNAKVYIAARSEEKSIKAIEEIKTAAPTSSGTLVFLKLDLSDLNSVKAAALEIVSREEKLHVLFNNAGVIPPPADPPASTVQGYELSLGVNCIGTFLISKLLTPILIVTARSEPADTVRVVWLSSFGLELYAHEGVGISLDNLDYHISKSAVERYGVSKCGAWALGVEFARRHKDDGIISIPINPGNLKSELARDQGTAMKLVAKMICYPTIMGACTELFAGLSSQVTLENSGSWVIPFGRFHPLRQDLVQATKMEEDGGTGGAYKFWEWNESQVRGYL